VGTAKPPAAPALIGGGTQGAHRALHNPIGLDLLEVQLTSYQAGARLLKHLVDKRETSEDDGGKVETAFFERSDYEPLVSTTYSLQAQQVLDPRWRQYRTCIFPKTLKVPHKLQ
jgi:hypothetical protein